MTATEAEIGRRVLAGLNKGRARRNQEMREQGEQTAEVVLELAALDVAAGKPAWGRAGRIARKLRGGVSERHVRRILLKFSAPLSSASEFGR